MGTHHSWGARLRPAIAACIIGMAVFAAGPAMAQQGAMRQMDVDTNNLFEDAFAFVKHNTYLKFGAAHLDFTGESSNLVVENAQGLAAQAFGPGRSSLYNTGSGIGDTTFPAGTIGIYVPWTGRHLATEVTIAAPISLDLVALDRAVNESLAPYVLGQPGSGGIPTGVQPLGEDLGSVKAFPPNLTLVFRPWVDTMIQPYIGIGAMYMYTYDLDIDNAVLNSVNEPTLYLSKPVACVGQVGVDVYLTEHIFLNADVKWIGCAKVTAKVNNVKVAAPNLGQFGAIDIGTVSTRVNLEATLYQLSIGIRF